jgi:dimethylhistidine N-methyltransferase
MRDEVIAGLSAQPRALSPKFFYDALGSKLFEAITVTPEYYPTDCELQILGTQGEAIAAVVGEEVSLVELGTGSATKVTMLLQALQGVREYVPIDISPSALEQAAVYVRRSFPDIRVTGVVADFTRPLDLPSLDPATRHVVFYPGSTIGNFERSESARFLNEIATWLAPGDLLLLGFDLVKDPAVLECAYDDAAGVTAAFNRNMLLHLNRTVGTDFDVTKFEHVAFWNADLSRIEMHLRATVAHDVHLGEHTFAFAAGETIHTESSHKYTVDGMRHTAEKAGFRQAAVWTDDREWFALAAFVRNG